MKKIFLLSLVLLPSICLGGTYDNWGFESFVKAEHGKVLFRGELKDDDGPFQYSDDHPVPAICGLFETKDTVFMEGSWNPEFFLPDWKDTPRFWPKIAAAAKSIPDASTLVIHDNKTGLPNQKITVENNEQGTRAYVEYNFPHDGTNSFPDEKTVMVIDFRGDQPVGFEKRFYLSPEIMTETYKFFPFKKNPSRQQKDETGRGYFMEYKCELSVTS